MELTFKRSILGTILFVILAILHFPAIWLIFDLMFNLDEMDWMELTANILQFLTIIIYILMLFVPLRRPWMRYLVAFIISFSFVINVIAFFWGLQYFRTFDLIALTVVIIDLMVIMALLMRPTNRLSKILPFYAEEEEIITPAV